MLRRTKLSGRRTRITFALPLGRPPGTVSVVGDFNGWEPGRHTLVPRRDGTRTVSTILPRRVCTASFTSPRARCGSTTSQADRVGGLGGLLEP